MVLFKPDNDKPCTPSSPQSVERTMPYVKHGTILMIIIGLFFIILFIAQLWTFCFLYGKLSTLEVRSEPAKLTQRKELQSLIKQEITSFFNEQLKFSNSRVSQNKSRQRKNQRKTSPRMKSTGLKVQEAFDVRREGLEKSYRDDRPPTGPPVQLFDGKQLTFKEKEDALRNKNVRKRSISETRYIDVEVEPAMNDQGQSVKESSDKPYVELTSYAKIPHSTIQKFCSRTMASCPAGPPGEKGQQGNLGIRGQKGDRGDRGLPGLKGEMGEIGLPGQKGHRGHYGTKGERGMPGKNGIDGRDGLPGEPGLDGIPGRHGIDGKDGKCSNGRDGKPGADGIPGIDGMKGATGLKGERGIKGQRGITGPRGQPGKNGKKGEPGKAGGIAFGLKGIEYYSVDKLLIAPTLAETSTKTLEVRENSRLRLSCLAAGSPKPYVEWSRRDPFAIATGYWRDGSVEGAVLNISHVSREHTGFYKCEAYNGVPPSAHRIFEIKVNFDPYIRITQWKVAAKLGQTVSLQCHVESYPQDVNYWENQEGRILERSYKYDIRYVEDETSRWKSIMTLTIKNIGPGDFGNYFCVAKNDLSATRGVIQLHKIDPTRFSPTTGKVKGITFGPDPPDFNALFNESCDTSKCCNQAEQRIGVTNLKYCIRIEKNGQKNGKKKECVLTAVGKPVFQAKTSGFGSWLTESKPGVKDIRYWRTISQDRNHIYQFSSKEEFRSGKGEEIDLKGKPMQGNSHVIYNGVFYYHLARGNTIAAFNLTSRTHLPNEINITLLEINKPLYSGSNNFVDFNTDENGLWAIFGVAGTDNTMVMKIDEDTFTKEFNLSISLNHFKFGEMFITCGILYAIESASEKETRISLALDLYKEHLVEIDLPFTNPVSSTTMLNYNPNTQTLHSWANGTQLTYPIKYEEAKKIQITP